MKIRQGDAGDVNAISEILQEIVVQTGRNRRTDPSFVIENYIDHPERLRCTVALDEHSELIGFQSLIRSWHGNPYDAPPGWGIVGTHISPRSHRIGVGTALFKATLAAAGDAGLLKLDAYIGSDNHGALRYYEAMGFQTYREKEGVVQKAYTIRNGNL